VSRPRRNKGSAAEAATAMPSGENGIALQLPDPDQTDAQFERQ
jgi:hypothetical protein